MPRSRGQYRPVRHGNPCGRRSYARDEPEQEDAKEYAEITAQLLRERGIPAYVQMLERDKVFALHIALIRYKELTESHKMAEAEHTTYVLQTTQKKKKLEDALKLGLSPNLLKKTTELLQNLDAEQEDRSQKMRSQVSEHQGEIQRIESQFPGYNLGLAVIKVFDDVQSTVNRYLQQDRDAEMAKKKQLAKDEALAKKRHEQEMQELARIETLKRKLQYVETKVIPFLNECTCGSDSESESDSETETCARCTVYELDPLDLADNEYLDHLIKTAHIQYYKELCPGHSYMDIDDYKRDMKAVEDGDSQAQWYGSPECCPDFSSHRDNASYYIVGETSHTCNGYPLKRLDKHGERVEECCPKRYAFGVDSDIILFENKHDFSLDSTPLEDTGKPCLCQIIKHN